MDHDKLREYYKALSLDKQLEFVSSLSPAAFNELRYYSDLFLRDSQIIPDNWKGRYYLCLCGRGWGKTKTGATWIAKRVHRNQAGLAIVAPTQKDLEEVMVPAILDEFPEDIRPKYLGGNKSKIICHNGIEILCFTSGTEIRGGNFSAVWCDELAKWCDAIEEKVHERFSVLDFANRKGPAQFLITTTPKAWKIFRDWEDRFYKGDPLIHIVRGSLNENTTLSPMARDALYQQYQGTRLGRQELNGELLRDTEGALWSQDLIDECRVTQVPEMRRIVVAVDPSTTANQNSDEVGIVVAGVGFDNKVYILDDLSAKLTPNQWATKAIMAYKSYKADRIIIETNQGGLMAEHVLRSVDRNVPIKSIHASKGKISRAEPVAGLYEQGRVKHVRIFPELENQMTSFTGQSDSSPDRLDAMVYAVTELAVAGSYVNINTKYLPYL